MKTNILITLFLVSLGYSLVAQPNFNKLAQITGPARINSTKVDKKGNIYYTGFYNYSSDFNVGTGTYTITAKGATDPFIAKYDSNYNLIWVKSIGGTSGYDNGYHIAVDDSGYVYGIGALVEGTCDLDPGPAILSHTVASVTGGRGMDIYIIKLDSAGTMKWVETFPSYNFNVTPEWYIDIDNAGNIVTSLYNRAGTTVDLSFGIGAPQPYTFTTNTFTLLKQSKYQQYVWHQTGVYATHFDFDENNNIYAVGDQMNIFKLNSAGSYVWGYILGSATSFNITNTTGDYASAICYDNKGHIYITGSTYNNAIDYNPGSGVQTLSHNNSSREIYVLKWDTTANFKWVKKFDDAGGCGTQYYNFAEDIKTDERGNVYTCGGFNACDFDPSPINNTILGQACGATDLFVSKLDSLGNYVWAKSIGSVNGTDYLKTMAITPAENVVFGGFFSYQFDIDPGPGVTYIGSTTSVQNALVGGIGCNKFSVKKDSTCVMPYVLNGYNYTQGGHYIQSIAASGASCDSLIYLDLKATNPNITVSTNTAICIGNTTSLTVNSTSSGVLYEWSTGDNISNIVVSPTVTTIYTATVTSIADSNCKSTKTISVTVNNLPIVTLGALSSPICANANSVTLNGSPSGGTYTGTGVSGNSFSPNMAGVGTHTLMYVYTNGNGCSNNDTTTVQVDNVPIVTLGALSSPMCVNANSVTLNGSPSGGAYTGTGVSGNVFNPTTAGAGTHTLMYVYTDGNGCSNNGMTTVQVDNLPVVTLGVLSSPMCVNSNSVTLNGSPSGGTYIGTGVSGNVFNPATAGVGTYTLMYLYTDGNGCSNNDSAIVQVYNLPTVTLGALSSPICANANSVTLNGSPVGGTYTGAGVSGNVFNPATAGVGTYTLMYVYTDINGCSNNGMTTVQVDNVPIVTLGALSSPMCVNANSVTLNGSPSGGAYTGTGVSGNVFNPTTAGAGTHTLMYVYTDGNGCSNNGMTTVQVDNLPVVTLGALSSPICVNANSVTLNGLPSGGTYTGTGVTGNVFTPATAGAGTHTLMYVYTDGNGCSNNDTTIVQVDLCTGIMDYTNESSELSIYPNPVNGILNVDFSDSFLQHQDNVLNMITKIKVTDILGKEINVELEVLNLNLLRVNVSELPRGIYFLKVGDVMKKFVKE